MKIAVIGSGCAGTQEVINQISKELANRGHEAVFVNDEPERLGTLDEVLKIQNKKISNEIFEIKALPGGFDFYNPSFQSNNRQARRKAEKEAKKRNNKNRKF